MPPECDALETAIMFVVAQRFDDLHGNDFGHLLNQHWWRHVLFGGSRNTIWEENEQLYYDMRVQQVILCSMTLDRAPKTPPSHAWFLS